MFDIELNTHLLTLCLFPDDVVPDLRLPRIEELYPIRIDGCRTCYV